MIKPTKRKAFNFLRSYFDVLNEIPKDKDKLDFLMAVINKQFLNEDPEDLNFLVNLCYESQRHQIESSVKGWERASNETLGTTLPTPLGTTPPTPRQEEEEKEKEKEEGQQVIQTFEQRKEKFLNWFNEQKKVHTGRKGSTKQMTSTDDNNLKKLLKAYDHGDFKIALSNMYKSQWAKENNMRTVSHFVRIENFNKYLEQGDTDQSKIAIFPDPVN